MVALFTKGIKVRGIRVLRMAIDRVKLKIIRVQ